MIKILVCDDDSAHGNEINDNIQAAGLRALPPLTGKQLTHELKKLFNHIKEFRPKAGEPDRRWDFSSYEPSPSQFDEVDVLLLDNNLTLLENDDGPPLTAEAIAGYVRAFTNARYIVSLNMNPDVDFDLRYLVGDFLTRADLAINGEHLTNTYLWTGRPEDAGDRFSPWYWPRLGDVAEYRERQIEFIRTNYEKPVLSSLGFDDESLHMLSRHALGALSPSASSETNGSVEGSPLREITFRQFFLAKSRALPIQTEREQLNAAYSQNVAVQLVVGRIVAADIDLWLRRDVIGTQEPLVDVPHLAGRLPFLLGDRANDLASWNVSVNACEAPFGWDEQMFRELVSAKRFEHEDIWTQKPCFWWPRLKMDERLDKQQRVSRAQNVADVVFCEDASQFRYRLGSADYPPPVEFVAEFEGVWKRRHIAKLDGVRYAPLTRLAL
jgi:hypothetical protein